MRASGDLDLATSHALENSLLHAFESRAQSIVIDLTEVGVVDASGVRLLDWCTRAIAARGRARADLEVSRDPKAVSRLTARRVMSAVPNLPLVSGDAAARRSVRPTAIGNGSAGVGGCKARSAVKGSSHLRHRAVSPSDGCHGWEAPALLLPRESRSQAGDALDALDAATLAARRCSGC